MCHAGSDRPAAGLSRTLLQDGSLVRLTSRKKRLMSRISDIPYIKIKRQKAEKSIPKKKGGKATKKAPGEKGITNIATVVGLVQASTEGISTTELKEKTGLAERQIWGIVNRASKEGKIKKMKRGLYGPT